MNGKLKLAQSRDGRASRKQLKASQKFVLYAPKKKKQQPKVAHNVNNFTLNERKYFYQNFT